MSEVYFGDDLRVENIQRATMRTIMASLAGKVDSRPAFTEFFASDLMEGYDAQGSWSFAGFALPEMLILQQLIEDIERDLPSAMIHWKEDRRPVFVEQFSAIREAAL